MGSGVDPSGTSLWVPMEFWGCHSKALRCCGGDWTCRPADGLARGQLVARAFSAHKVHQRLPAVQCIHVLKNSQRAALIAQNGAVFNLFADTKHGLRKRFLQGFVAQPQPNIGRATPQGAQMNYIITEGVAKRTTCKQW